MLYYLPSARYITHGCYVVACKREIIGRPLVDVTLMRAGSCQATVTIAISSITKSCQTTSVYRVRYLYSYRHIIGN